MKTLEIDLTFRRLDFEELYFRNGNEKLFFSPTSKSQAYISIVVGLLFVNSLINFIITDTSQETVLFLFILWCVTLILFGEKIYKVLKWRKSIKTFLDKTSKYKVNKVILTENAMLLIEDTTETIEKWSNFKRVTINNESITMYGDENYLFPRKSMTAEEYELFKNIVHENIRNGL
ncbi:YcxB family protein [Flavobacterium sp. HJJ]|uniref:YcxB family protein n=1 Tax=Flavobacterium sp. HJJ TaxID=2783792 RepID=UPI00188BB0D1|nr:YcxB family protein [Flavobacterium sp. HJJ]MBF4473783.1 YcxB family protein [Flavobacterium sp. HJJ]